MIFWLLVISLRCLTNIGITRRNFVWEGSYLARKVDTLGPFQTLSDVLASLFRLIDPIRDFVYNDIINIMIRLAVQTVLY
jgi:hypothetical protein